MIKVEKGARVFVNLLLFVICLGALNSWFIALFLTVLFDWTVLHDQRMEKLEAEIKELKNDTNS